MGYLLSLIHGSPTHIAWAVFGFVVVLTVLVFVHEFGHYWIARRNGVKIEVFSIGFGPELFGWWDRAGTRWKFSALPLGGYVKMFGDSDPSSGTAIARVGQFTEAEREVSFHCKRLGQRAAIVAGGPLANFVFAIVLLSVLFMTQGQPFTPATVGEVQPGSAADEAGMQAGDTVQSVDNQRIGRFEDLQLAIQLADPGTPLQVMVDRGGKSIALHITPQPLLGIGRGAPTVDKVQADSAADLAGIKPGDRIISIAGQPIRGYEDVTHALRHECSGNQLDIVVERGSDSLTLHTRTPPPVLGVGRVGVEYVRRGPISGVAQAFAQTWELSAATLRAMWQMLPARLRGLPAATCSRATGEIGGPIKIAQLSGEMIQLGIGPLLWFMAVLSVNLGLINLFPVPVLDGGHLLFYAAEAIRGRPLGQRAQEYGFRVGLALVLTLMVFATWNDVFH